MPRALPHKISKFLNARRSSAPLAPQVQAVAGAVVVADADYTDEEVEWASTLGAERVLVLEQHYIAGGCTHCFEEHGYEFDTARRDSAEDFCRLDALLFTAMGWTFIPAYCFAGP